MTKLGRVIICLNMFIGSLSFAQAKRVEAISDVQGIENLENILPNPSFDKNSASWTATGFTASAATTGPNLGRGARSLVVDMDTTNDLIETASITIPNYMKSQLGMGWCRFLNPNLTGGSTTDYQLRVTDGSTALTDISATNLIPGTASFQRHSQYFLFPSSGSVRLQIRAMSGTVSEMAVDDCYLGLAPNYPQFVGNSYFPVTGGCDWQRTNTTLGAFGTTAACPGPTVEASKIGTWQTTDADLPKQTINNLPPGRYVVTVTLGTSMSTGAGIGTFTISDGTTTSGRGHGTNNTSDIIGSTVVGSFEYTTTANRTFEVFGAASANTVNINNSAGQERLTFTIVWYPL